MQHGINWDKARTGWAQYYDDGVITLNPDIFFKYQKNKVKK